MREISITFFICCLILVNCVGPAHNTIVVTNQNELWREGETVEVPLNSLKELPEGRTNNNWRVKDNKGVVILSQLADTDGDEKDDMLLFQCAFDAAGSQEFTVVLSDDEMPKSLVRTYGRYVPERHDDFTVENDLIAFRIYGPGLQKLKEDGNAAGGISSGIDNWLKRVNYPIVDKWYEKDRMGGSYHVDDGEGFDPYHVGASAGCGGICVMDGEKRFASKNYTTYRILTNGPIRSIFEFEYEAWDANGVQLKETKRLTIDLGNRLAKWQSKFESDELPQFGVGITLHNDVNANTNFNEEEGWIRLWEKMSDSELGNAVIVPPGKFEGVQSVLSQNADESHIILKTSADHDILTYYAGYGWKKAGDITSPELWETYLSNFSKRLKTPLAVEIY